MERRGKFNDTDMQTIIGWILRTGVIVSIAIVIFGGVLYIYRHGGQVADYHTFQNVPVFVRGIGNIVVNIFNFRGQAIIQFGILMLIATPVMRVVFAAIGFALEKDRLYVFISLLVLFIIFASAFGGHIG